jgi:hypothetical protein
MLTDSFWYIRVSLWWYNKLWKLGTLRILCKGLNPSQGLTEGNSKESLAIINKEE